MTGPDLGRVRVVFLDAGHTLLRPDPAVELRYASTAARFGIRGDPAAIRERFGRLWREGRAEREAGLYRTDAEGTERFWRGFVARVFEPWTGGGEAFDRFFEALYEEFTTPAAWRLFDDALPCLESLRGAGLRLAVVSNWDLRLRDLLDRLGVSPLFEATVISAEVGFEKPAPQIFARALEAMAALPSETLHVGDSLEDDVAGALGAGLDAAHLDRRAPATAPAELPGLGRYLVTPSLAALASLF